MPDETQPTRSSAEPITALIAERVRARREAADLSQAELAEEMAKRGVPWKRATVVNLEKRAASSRGTGGGRDAISVQELLTLALVLDVPPVTLIADPRASDTVPVAEGLEVDQWEALMWMVGTGTIDPPTGRAFTNAAWLIHAGFTVVEALGDLRRVDRGSDPEQAQQRTDDRHRQALERMRDALVRINAQGAPPPRLADWVFQRAAELGIDLLVEMEG